MHTPFFTVTPRHELAYNSIVKPHRRWAFSYYFLYRWLPLLHPQQAMLIQVLRQSTWQSGRPTGACQLTNATLCHLLGWSDSSHKTLLTELERPYSDWFITRERTRKRHVTEGHAVEGAPRYKLQMDEPLTPADQAALSLLLRRHHPTTPYEAAEVLSTLAKERSRDLWAMLDENAAPCVGARPTTVASVAATTWSHLPPGTLTSCKPFLDSAEQLQLRLTGAGYAHMELDYMMRGWLPTLGINNTWLVIALRARCFYDPQTSETRDVVVVSRRDLEKQLGIPERTFRRLLRDDTTLPFYHIAPVNEDLNPNEPRTIPHRGDLAFHIAYPLLPITPKDRLTYEQLLLDDAEAVPMTLSTRGQPTLLEADKPPLSHAQVIHTRQTNPAGSGQSTRLTPAKADIQPCSKRTSNPAETVESGQPTLLKADNQPDIPTSIQVQEALTAKKPTSLPSLGRGENPDGREQMRNLLEPFAIQGIQAILQNNTLTVAEVQGWIYRAQDEVDRIQWGGYLFRRLRVGSDVAATDPLPERYRLAGEVSTAETMQFQEWWLEELSPPPFADDAQRQRYGAWCRVVKKEAGNPDRPDYAPHACFRRDMERERVAYSVG